MTNGAWQGPLLIALGAMLWATDALTRLPAVNRLDPTLIVFFEHAIGTLLLLPWILIRELGALLKLKPSGWVAVFFAGAGGSAVATVLFTASFRYVNPSVAILLQKLQPVLVLMMAVIFLKERPANRFYGWAGVALAAGIVLSFPDLKFGFLAERLNPHSQGVLYAFSAAAIWAICTVVGKVMLDQTSTTIATFWRYGFGLGMLGVLLASQSSPVAFTDALQTDTLKLLAYMAAIPGVLAMLLYYAGLRRTPASVATFVELVFPVTAVLLNTYFLNTPLTTTELVAGAVLLVAVSQVSRASQSA